MMVLTPIVYRSGPRCRCLLCNADSALCKKRVEKSRDERQSLDVEGANHEEEGPPYPHFLDTSFLCIGCKVSQ